MAETHGGGVIGVLLRCLCITAGALVAGFVLAVLAPGSGRAHADSGREPEEAVGGAVDDGSTDVGAFWARPDSLSSAAARRAVAGTAEQALDPWLLTPRAADEVASEPVALHGRTTATTSAPIGAVGSGSSSSDAGPSMSQLAVLASALAAVLWLWQADADVDSKQTNTNAPTSVDHRNDHKSKSKAGDGGSGGGGSVSQSNEATNSAEAGNSNDTIQDVAQGQGASGSGHSDRSKADAKGGHGHGGGHEGSGQDQTVAVESDTEQKAEADVDSTQSNISAGVTVGGAGGGSVSQSNEATNGAEAGNLNETAQAVDQGQAGTAGSSQEQSADVANATDQSASADVTNQQYNVYAPVAVNSPGANSGSVTQSNSADNGAFAGNINVTDQAVTQSQAGAGSGGGQDQVDMVANHTSQSANAGVHNGQWNIYSPVYVNSRGAGSGNVSQSNSATNTALAGNANFTSQDVDQAQASGGGAAGQRQTGLVVNRTRQSANVGVFNAQGNIHNPVTVGGAGSGTVSQANSASNSSSAFNLNGLIQRLAQAMGMMALRF